MHKKTFEFFFVGHQVGLEKSVRITPKPQNPLLIYVIDFHGIYIIAFPLGAPNDLQIGTVWFHEVACFDQIKLRILTYNSIRSILIL